MNAGVKTLMVSGLKERNPNDPPDLICKRMADLILGSELALKAYGPLPDGQHVA